jgi:hypothetical protein
MMDMAMMDRAMMDMVMTRTDTVRTDMAMRMAGIRTVLGSRSMACCS